MLKEKPGTLENKGLESLQDHQREYSCGVEVEPANCF